MNLIEQPLHHCQSKYCPNEGHYWHGRIARYGDKKIMNHEPENMEIPILGWCDHCRRFVCMDCAIQVDASNLDIAELLIMPDYTTKILQFMIAQKADPTTRIRKLVCRRCGTTLGKTQDWLFLEGTPYTNHPINCFNPPTLLERLEKAAVAFKKGDIDTTLKYYDQSLRMVKREDWEKSPDYRELFSKLSKKAMELTFLKSRST